MGRGGAFVALCMLAACSPEPGAVLEIEVGALDVASVELFLGASACSDCAAITPRGFGGSQTGEVWLLDAPRMFATPVTGGVARVKLEPGEPVFIPLVEIVGFSSSGTVVAGATLRDVEVPRTEAEIWHVALSPLATWTEASTGTAPRATVWRRPAEPEPGRPGYPAQRPGCLGIEDAAKQRRFLVPADDRDCDGYEPDCDPLWFEFPGTPTTEACLTETPACQTGFRTTCADALGGPGCGARPICLPARACAECQVFDASCESRIQPALDTAHVRCKFPFAVEGGVGVPCVGAPSALLDLDPLFGNGVTCSDAGFSTWTPLISSLQRSTGFTTAMTQGLVNVSEPRSECQLDVSWSGSAAGTNSAATFRFTILASNGNTLLMRMYVQFEPGCTLFAPYCEVIAPTDPIWTCAQ